MAHDDASAAARPQLRGPLELVKLSAEYLAERGVPAPRLDAELLLAHVLGTTRLRLYLEFERPVVPAELDRYRELIRQRGRRVPLQLLTGEVHLLDLRLRVRPGVFIPRPETETLIETTRALYGAGEEPARFVEVGVGTGAIGIALLKGWPHARAVGYDVSAAALELAAANAGEHGVAERFELRVGDPLGARVPEPAPLAQAAVDLVVSNPPYVRSADIATLEPEVRDHDPHAALDGGPDGLHAIRRLVDYAAGTLRPGGWLTFEHGDDQAEACAALLAGRGFTAIAVHNDLAGRPRVSIGRMPGSAEG